MELSQRILKRAQTPLYLESTVEKEAFLAEKRPHSFSTSVETKNDGEITLFGLIDENQVPPQFLAIKYTGNLKQEVLALVDVFVEFSTGKDIRGIKALSLREIDSFLRDNNLHSAFPENNTNLLILFDQLKKALEKVIEADDQRPAGEKISPTINRDYKNKGSYYPYNNKNNYHDLDQGEKAQLIAQIIEDHIATPLSRDGGGIYCVFTDDNLVVIEYLGACQGCLSSLTTTMNFIQRVFQLETGAPGILVMTDS